MHKALISVPLVLSINLVHASAIQLTADPPLMDHAVLQRGVAFDISGSSAGERVELSFGAERLTASVEQGRWSVSFPPMRAAEGERLTITSGKDTLVFDDVAVGDVIFCSGQSNMVWPVSRSTGRPNQSIVNARDIRLLHVVQHHAGTDQRQLPAGSDWERATLEHVEEFSAVCWYTAEQQSLDGVPMGLVQAAWGGSHIETWLPRESLVPIGLYDDQLKFVDLFQTDEASALRDYGSVWERAWVSTGREQVWKRQQAEGKRAPSTPMDWHRYDDRRIADHDGHVWFGKQVNLTEEEARQAIRVHLGVIGVVDATWINGHFLGTTNGRTEERIYEVPSGLLRAGPNTITINVFGRGGQAGLLGPSASMYIEKKDGTRMSIGDGWLYEVERPGGIGPLDPPWTARRGYTTIHNAMVAPLRNLTASKAVWYQGEGNSRRSGEYSALLDALIASWKERFGDDLQTVIVQLPGYGAVSAEPTESGWAGVRAAQREVAEARDDVGLAVIIDAGDPWEIHPANKKIVATRVTESFMAIEAGSRHADGSGPINATVQGGRVVVDLTPGDYHTVSGSRPTAVEVCSADGQCRWADSLLSGSRLVVSPTGDQEVATVRYCWGDAPICNLFRDNGSPVTPFEVTINSAAMREQ